MQCAGDRDRDCCAGDRDRGSDGGLCEQHNKLNNKSVIDSGIEYQPLPPAPEMIQIQILFIKLLLDSSLTYAQLQLARVHCNVNCTHNQV